MKSSSQKKRAVVIGTGLGGAGVAALLQHSGFDVLLLERNNYPGGKASTLEQEGFHYDTGVHYTGSGPKGPLGLINEKVQGDLRWCIPDPFSRLVCGDQYIDMPVRMNSFKHRLNLTRKFMRIRPRNYIGAFRAYNKIVGARREQDLTAYDEIPLKDFCDQYTDDEQFHRWINLYSLLMVCIPYSQASTGEYMWCMSTWTRNASCSYPKGGFGAIAEAYIRALQRDGGEVRYGNEVKAIAVKDGTAVGVEADRFYEADVIISNAGIHRTVSMAGEDHFPPEYVEQTKGLRSSYSAVSIKYFLDRPVFKEPMIIHYDPDADLEKACRQVEQGQVPDMKDLAILLPIVSNVDLDLAPPGKQLVQAGTVGGPPELKYAEIWDKMLDLLDEKILALYPEMKKHIIKRIKTNPKTTAGIAGRETGDIIGLAQSYDQCGRKKPRAATPVKNLYLVGCDAGGRGIGTEQAADSALKVSEMVLKDFAS